MPVGPRRAISPKRQSPPCTRKTEKKPARRPGAALGVSLPGAAPGHKSSFVCLSGCGGEKGRLSLRAALLPARAAPAGAVTRPRRSGGGRRTAAGAVEQ